MKGTLMLVTTHPPFVDERQDVLPAPQVVATITLDPRLLRKLEARKVLEQVAGKLGLQEFVIVQEDELKVPGTQIPLFQ